MTFKYFSAITAISLWMSSSVVLADAQPLPQPTTVMLYHPVSFYVRTGSLRHNLEHIVAQFGWRTLIWQSSYDYAWVGNTKIRGDNLQLALSKVLENYPVQAVFYQGNHVVAILPRTLKQ